MKKNVNSIRKNVSYVVETVKRLKILLGVSSLEIHNSTLSKCSIVKEKDRNNILL